MNALPKEWLRLASEDYRTAQILFKESVWNHVCFHAQQAAEKGLKALIETKGDVPKVHDLLMLANGVPGRKEAEQALDGLNDFLEFVRKQSSA